MRRIWWMNYNELYQSKNVGKAYRQYHSKTGRLIEWLSPLNTKRHNLEMDPQRH
jgi:hypothetical protein